MRGWRRPVLSSLPVRLISFVGAEISLDSEFARLYDTDVTEERIVVGRLGGPVMPALSEVEWAGIQTCRGFPGPLPAQG